MVTYYLFEDASSSFSDGPHVVEDALSAYLMPLFRQSPSVSVRLDVFLLSPEVAIPDLFYLG